MILPYLETFYRPNFLTDNTIDACRITLFNNISAIFHTIGWWFHKAMLRVKFQNVLLPLNCTHHWTKVKAFATKWT